MVITVELFLEFIAIPHDTKATVELPVHILIACFGAYTLIALSFYHNPSCVPIMFFVMQSTHELAVWLAPPAPARQETPFNLQRSQRSSGC